MSRIGKQPVRIPDGVEVTLNGQAVSAKGPKGTMQAVLPALVRVSQGDGAVTIAPIDKSQNARRYWGTSRAVVNNLIAGVSDGFVKKLTLNGVGYRAQMQGATLRLALGFSHDVNFPVPDDIKIDCPSQTEITISGIDKQRVGQIAAEIRNMRPPEPYKGKGVHYEGEYVFRKEGKKK